MFHASRLLPEKSEDADAGGEAEQSCVRVCVCVRRRASQEVIYGAAQPTCPSSRPAGGEIKMQPSAVAAETRLMANTRGEGGVVGWSRRLSGGLG